MGLKVDVAVIRRLEHLMAGFLLKDGDRSLSNGKPCLFRLQSTSSYFFETGSILRGINGGCLVILVMWYLLVEECQVHGRLLSDVFDRVSIALVEGSCRI